MINRCDSEIDSSLIGANDCDFALHAGYRGNWPYFPDKQRRNSFTANWVAFDVLLSCLSIMLARRNAGNAPGQALYEIFHAPMQATCGIKTAVCSYGENERVSSVMSRYTYGNRDRTRTGPPLHVGCVTYACSRSCMCKLRRGCCGRAGEIMLKVLYQIGDYV